MASKKNGESPTKANTIPTREKECIEVQASQSRAKTKEKAKLKDAASGFAKPQKPSKRARSEEKSQQNPSSNQQGSKRGPANAGAVPSRPNQLVSNKILKKLLVKYDDCNESKLDDFIGLNKFTLDDQLSIHNSSWIQACSRIAAIKTVEVPVDDSKDTSRLEV